MTRVPRHRRAVKNLRRLVGRILRFARSLIPWQAWQDRRVATAQGTTPVGAGARRLLIAPVNSAGQAYAWARAAERLPGVAAANFMYVDPSNTFRFPADQAVPTALFRTNRPWQAAQQRHILSKFTHVIIESGRPIFNAEGPVDDHINLLVSNGITPALLWHGSDIRSPSDHCAREPDSPFLNGRYPETDRLEEIVQRHQRLIAERELMTFVSTPDLLIDVPRATWLPVVIEPARWAVAAAQPALTRERLRVVHAPSNAGLKGSELIEDAMRRLHDEGVIEFVALHRVPADEMPQHYGRADVVLDQFSLGIYGVAACEAMASGRLVISHVSGQTRRAVRESTGMDLPILQSRADELESILRSVAADREQFAGIAARGPAFVKAVHDGRRTAGVLGHFLGVSGEQLSGEAWETGGMPSRASDRLDLS